MIVTPQICFKPNKWWLKKTRVGFKMWRFRLWHCQSNKFSFFLISFSLLFRHLYIWIIYYLAFKEGEKKHELFSFNRRKEKLYVKCSIKKTLWQSIWQCSLIACVHSQEQDAVYTVGLYNNHIIKVHIHSKLTSWMLKMCQYLHIWQTADSRNKRELLFKLG